VRNLAAEGLSERARLTGDVMYDAYLVFREAARRHEAAARWKRGEFALATIHRAENTDDAARLDAILEALDAIAESLCPVVLPLHPRTRKVLEERGRRPRSVTVVEPLSYLEMLLLESRARFVLTDSGGVQKEAYFARVPCITLRDETEWVETLENGCNTLAGAHTESIVAAARNTAGAGPWTPVYGHGDAGRKTLAALLDRI
jgi:UDP-N-acetylglucosamine 2-epimerase